MPDQEHIAAQRELLATYRRTLFHYMNQQAAVGEAYMSPAVSSGLREARDNIKRIKRVLRDWGQTVDDLPDDEPYTGISASPQTRVFISYKRNVNPDEEVALAIFNQLSQHYQIFIDQTMRIGTRWAQHLEAEIRQSDFLIVLLSAQSVLSEMVLEEVRTASNLAPNQGGRPVILPVRLNYREPFPAPLDAFLDPINWAFWGAPHDTPQLLADLEHAIVGGELAINSLQTKQTLLRIEPPPTLPQPTPSAQIPNRRSLPIVELPEGTMDPQSAFYIVRPSDVQARRTITRNGVTITIKGARQMGKSSLLIRVIDEAIKVNKHVVSLDFQLLGHAAILDADRFFRQFCSLISDELGVEDQVERYWNNPFSNSKRCSNYMERYILKQLDLPLVLAMDEVDTLFECDFRDDFFGMLRSWHNSRASKPMWKKLDLALVTSTEPYQFVTNLHQSPFNVGEVLDVEDFTPNQVAELNERHGSPLSAVEVQRLMDLLGGHPYLVRRALYLLAVQLTTVPDLFAYATADRGPFGDHLRHHLWRLHDKSELVRGLRQVIQRNECTDQHTLFRLQGAGLIRSMGATTVVPRCRLYAEFFRERLHD